ncbi:hypothetical protein ARMGADRAFT_951218, partial [Armillaria gallica]
IATYPSFHPTQATWQAVFMVVVQPMAIWTVYAPKSLGGYCTVCELWQSWDEGTIIEDVGCLPPIRIIDEKWGNLKNKQTGTGGKFPLWRPRNDDQAHTWWSKYFFFITRIQKSIAEGKSSDAAIAYFEDIHVASQPDTVNALHKSMQPKRTKKKEHELEKGMDIPAS